MKKKYFLAFLDALLVAWRTAAALLLGNAILVQIGVIGQPSQFIQIGLIGVMIAILASIPWVSMLRSGKDE